MPRWRVGYPIAAAMIWAGSPVAAKLSVGIIAPVHIAFLRWLTALVILTPFIVPTFPRDRRVLIRALPQLALLGFLGMVVYQSLAYFAVRFTTVSDIGILNATIPIFVTIIEAIWLRRSQPFGVVAGCVVTFFGIAVLLSHGHGMRFDAFGFNVGDGLILLSCLSYALYSVLVSRTGSQVDQWHSLYLQVLAAVLFLTPGSIISTPTLPEIRSLPILFYVGILSSILAPYAWMQGVRHLGPSRTSIYLNLVPTMTLAFAVVFLGEPLSYVELIGGLLSLLGVVMSQVSI